MKVEKRVDGLSQVRAENKVPGVLFGKEIDPVSIQIEEKELNEAISTYGYTRTFDIKLGRKKHTVILKDVQRDVLKSHIILNVKLHKVSAGDTISANVPLNLIGKDKIEKPGVLVHIEADTIEVEYQVGSGVSAIDLDISNLKIGDSIHVRDIALPEAMNALDDEDKLIISVSEIVYTEETEEAETEPEPDPSQVEAIKQKEEE